MTTSLARSNAREAIVEPVRFNAPLFRSLVERLDSDERCVVLDLGAARAQTIELFGRYRCRLDIADLTDGVDELNAETESDRLYAAAERMLPVPHGEEADAVLCWDIPNYLGRPALSALMSCIAERTRAGGLVHMLIIYSETHMPERPGHFVPQQDQSLLDVSIDRHVRKAPRYAPTDLTDCLPAFSMERAMLLSNGMQEILFRV